MTKGGQKPAQIYLQICFLKQNQQRLGAPKPKVDLTEVLNQRKIKGVLEINLIYCQNIKPNDLNNRVQCYVLFKIQGQVKKSEAIEDPNPLFSQQF